MYIDIVLCIEDGAKLWGVGNVTSLFLIPNLVMYNVDMIYHCGPMDVICKHYILNIIIKKLC
jgi:hypothetical protein